MILGMIIYKLDDKWHAAAAYAQAEAAYAQAAAAYAQAAAAYAQAAAAYACIVRIRQTQPS